MNQRTMFPAWVDRELIKPAALPPHNGTPTSLLAASGKVATVAHDRERVYVYVASCGERGATREEIELGLGMRGNTVRPRVCELIRDGRLRERGDKRSTSSGSAAMVLRVR